MTAEQRREALVRSTLPLLLEHGRSVTTRQIAEAAGVAEGTIFRVFESKHDLIGEAVVLGFDPAPLERGIAAVDPHLPFRDRLLAVVTLLQQRFLGIFELMQAMGLMAPPVARAHHRDQRERVTQLMVDLVGEDAAALRVDAGELVHYLRLLTFSASNPHIADGRLLTPEQIVSLVLDGVRRREEDPR